ncbi:predicted protein [Lichtheimia corymbifera JMRC:FSU:9682]|uniref:Uncharacterized protein n=1 Tax=Lichtheimia corymbifera JMRC:FSU:9682 TaxID=1263082 RepID=A0A068S535_9FUNG|nr:predicted protein [Lichtheimia corymbifera JMRC:FSU:9682]
MPKTPPSLLPPFIDQSKQSFFTNSNEQRDDNEGLIEWDSFERLEREYEQTYLEDNTKTEVDSDYYDELPKHHYIYRQDPIEQRGGGEDYRVDQENDGASPRDQEPQGVYGPNDTRSPNQSEQDDQEPEPVMPVSHGLMTLHERMKLHLDGIASLMEKAFEQIHQTQEGHEELAEVVRAHRLALAERGAILNQQCEQVRAHVDSIENSLQGYKRTSSPYPSPILSRKNEHHL